MERRDSGFTERRKIGIRPTTNRVESGMSPPVDSGRRDGGRSRAAGCPRTDPARKAWCSAEPERDEEMRHRSKTESGFVTGHGERMSALVVSSRIGLAKSPRSRDEHAAALDRLLADLAEPDVMVRVRPISPVVRLRIG